MMESLKTLLSRQQKVNGRINLRISHLIGGRPILPGLRRTDLSPVPAKTLPLPAHHRVGMDDEQSLPPVLPHHRDRHPEPAVSPGRPWTLLRALVDGELLT